MSGMYKAYYNIYSCGEYDTSLYRIFHAVDDDDAFTYAAFIYATELEIELALRSDKHGIEAELMYVSVIDPEDKSHELEIIYG